jgi:poly(hydroxyalkanoate) depolymerase family esterase
MRNLSDTIARLKELQRMPLPLSNFGLSQNGRLSRFDDFGSNPGSLVAWAYTPADLPRGAALVVVLHGCSQTAAGYDDAAGWSRMADLHGFALLFPEQQRANNANLCFNWFVPSDCQRGSGEALSISQMIEAAVVRFGIDRNRIYINGLSAGGAMASAMLASYPELFAGGAVIAGLPFDCAKTVPEAFDRMGGQGLPSKIELQKSLRKASPHKSPWPTITVWHGEADRTVFASNADAVVSQWLEAHELGEEPSLEMSMDGCKRRVWMKGGEKRIEEYLIQGMGHGTPIAAGGENDEKAAPFMLDVGISSTRELAVKWGLASPMASASPEIREPSHSRAESELATASAILVGPNPRPQRQASGVRSVIESALRTAGLMR